ncbi:helix-turn-helix transcriptional regulator [Heliomicrobium undosum]|nr:helix-turn-helix transcriptional regulator [Heliomicrobium undosum]
MESAELRQTLYTILETKDAQALFACMEENLPSFFATPDIPEFYHILKDVDLSTCPNLTPKLMLAWMAFLSGDHAGLFPILKSIDEAELQGPPQCSLFYTLKAMVGYLTDPQEGLRYAEIAMDILPDGDTPSDASFYSANARLTYGQLLANSGQYRHAAELFAAAYHQFDSLNLAFPASVALVNENLNRFKLGEFAGVIDRCNEAMMKAGRFQGETQRFWDALHLPLGMCCYELNKPNLAIRHLNAAKACIDAFGLFHMHGMVELYLFKCFTLLGDLAAMERLKNETIAKFETVCFQPTDAIISLMRILSCPQPDSPAIQPDIEKFELEFIKNRRGCNAMIVDVLVYLRLQGFSDVVAIEDLETRLERLRYIGHIPQIQTALLQIAELHHLENRPPIACNYLREAVNMVKEFGISACFHAMPLRTLGLLQKIEPRLFATLSKQEKGAAAPADAVLTAREREIMGLIAQGKSNDEISKALYIGIGTIKWHINHIFGKLEVKNRVQAIAKAKSLGEI